MRDQIHGLVPDSNQAHWASCWPWGWLGVALLQAASHHHHGRDNMTQQAGQWLAAVQDPAGSTTFRQAAAPVFRRADSTAFKCKSPIEKPKDGERRPLWPISSSWPHSKCSVTQPCWQYMLATGWAHLTLSKPC